MRLLGCVFLLLILIAPHAIRAEGEATSRVGEDIRYLASDELEGRGVQTKGIRKAAEYIRAEFKRVGLKSGTKDGTYFQKFKVPLRDKPPVLTRNVLAFQGPDGKSQKWESGKSYQPLRIGGPGKAKAEVVFVGYGISAPQFKYDDYKGVDVKGKIVVLIRREPQQADEKSVFEGKKVTSHSYVMSKINLAKRRGAAAVLLVNDPHSADTDAKDSLVAIGQFSNPNPFVRAAKVLPFAQLKISAFNAILAKSPVVDAEGNKLTTVAAIEEHINADLKPLTQPLKGWTAEVDFAFVDAEVEAENVIGVLEGEGPLANETVVIGAHYDHLGYGGYGSRSKTKKREIHNGADDNATGTAAVIELARRFAGRDKKPKRRIVFIAFSGEERGLVGSAYYVRKPLFPIKDTVTMINYDMIGTLRNNQLTVTGSGSSKGFGELLDKANDGIDFQLRKPAGPPGGSDQVWFYRNKIPAVHFFTGLTSLYHTPGDDYEELNVEGAVRVIDISEKFIAAVADLEKRPAFAAAARRPRRTRLPYLGVLPDLGATTNKGVVLDDVSPNSPALKAGFKPGDIIVKIGQFDVTDLGSLTAALGRQKGGQKVKVIVKRGKDVKTLEVVFGAPR